MDQDYYTSGEKEFLLKIARQSLEKYLFNGERFEPQTVNKKLWERRGVLVSLKNGKNEIGRSAEGDLTESLIVAVRNGALSAVKKRNLPGDGLNGISIEIIISSDSEDGDEKIVFGE